MDEQEGVVPVGAGVSPSAARNRGPILAALAPLLARPGRVLEVASGTGEHAVFLASGMPDVIWQPTEREAAGLSSLAAWPAHAGLANVLAPVVLDVCGAWPAVQVDAVVSINMIHIAPWAATEGLMRGAAGVLAPGGRLFLYGPFMEGGRHSAASNAAFDADLRGRDPAWGVRDLVAVAEVAGRFGLVLQERVAMPANNLVVVFGRG